MFTRRNLVVGGSALLGACAAPGVAPGRSSAQVPFVRREGIGFRIGTAPYRIVGTNMWYAPFLGADAPIGDRARLGREFDRLSALGIDNVRILGSAELSPLKNSITPGFRDRSANYNETLLRGLDHALAEMGQRNMKAVIYLTNFWEWSGGMATYNYWTNGGSFINMNDPAHPWPAFADFSSQFYQNAPAVAMYHDYVRALVTRRNSVTGRLYADDPAIMSWQLANEPRPGGSDAAIKRQLPAYIAWINATARLIKSLDPNHLVSTGSEGTQSCNGDIDCVVQAHASPDVDYVTAHIWPQNWGWADPKNLAGTFPTVEKNTREYIANNVTIAQRLGKPLVIEEFGFPREGGSFDPAVGTANKDRFYRLIFEAVENSVRTGGVIQGSNFWAWGGEGRAAHADYAFVRGDTSYMGDPPHEPQGWYSVLAGDASTQALIRAHSAAVKAAA
jgi:mannan endo-1,4-beta-mannosidase